MYFAVTVPGYRDYRRFDHEWREHYLWDKKKREATVGKRPRRDVEPKNAKRARRVSRDTPDEGRSHPREKQPCTDGVIRILEESTNKAFSRRLKLFADDIMHKITVAGLTHKLVVAVNTAITPAEAIENIIHIISKHVDSSTDRFRLDEFEASGELHWPVFEFQIL